MGKINILHISDAHIEKSGEKKVTEIVTKLCRDIERISMEKNIKIDLICFSGDLIQSGEQAFTGEKQWELADNILVTPLIEQLHLGRDAFVMTPGNHEVDCSKIKTVLEKGLDVYSLEEIQSNYDEMEPSFKDRINYFYEKMKKAHHEAEFAKLGYTVKKQIEGNTVGIACVDSAWRSSGIGWQERGKMYICKEQIEDLYNMLEDCDIKICMLHHPLDWLVESEMHLVEQTLSKFDIVLNGHVHENYNKQNVHMNYNTIFSTAGKLYPIDLHDGREIDGYNGYTILSLDTEKKECLMYIRSYYAMTRHEFDSGVNLCPDGMIAYRYGKNDKNFDVEFGLKKGIYQFFKDMTEKFSFIKARDNRFPEHMEDLLIEPILSRSSDYVKEKDEKNSSIQININDVIDEIENQLIIGKKEIGKTTVLQIVALRLLANTSSTVQIPLYVNMNQLCKGQDRIFMSAFLFASQNVTETTSISKEQFRNMMNNEKFVILVDDFDMKKGDHCKWISEFNSKYPQCKSYLTVEEEFFQSIDIKQMPTVFEKYQKTYIQNIGRKQIRQLVSKWSDKEEREVDELVFRIDSYCNQINFAKTPFNVSVFMVIWDFDISFVPTNEGILMQNYLEIVLDKLSPNEANLENYAFYIKEDFLSSLAYSMYKKGEYFYTYEEFLNFVSQYHTRKGYNVNESKFDKVFFDKNILTITGGNVFFSRTSFLEYFLAIYATNNEFFLDEMLEDGKREYFKNELCFCAGLKKDCSKILEILSDKILGTIVENIDLIDELNDVEIVTEFKVDKEEMLKNIKSNRLSIDDVDDIADSEHKYEEKKPTEIRKDSDTEKTADSFYVTLDIYGGVLKNAELLDNDIKINHLENYMYGMNMLYAMMIKLFEEFERFQSFEKLTEEQKELFEVTTEAEYKKKQTQLIDITKLVFPIAVQNLIFESVGTPKMKAAIDELVKKKNDCPFEKFMLIFLKFDLGIAGNGGELRNYIRQENAKSILKMVYMKLTYYYRMRVFGRDEKIDRLLLDLLTDIHMKLYPQKNQQFQKATITKVLKEQLDQQLIEAV